MGMHVITSKDDPDFQAVNQPFPEQAAFTFYEPGEDEVTVVIDATLVGDELYETCIHEAVHVWQFVKAHVREQHPGAETEAYFIVMVTKALVAACVSGKDSE